MRALLLGPYYIKWHYSEALTKGFKIYSNFIWFIGHFFSMGILAKTLFAPWQRMVEERDRNFTFQNFFSTITINLVVRFAGAVIRGAFIFIGLLCMAVVTGAYMSVLVIWLLLPIAIVVSIFTSLGFLVKII